MTRIVNNTRKCIDCGNPVPRKVLRCPACHKVALLNRPTYERTPEHNLMMSQITTGLKRPGFVPASKRPEIAQKILAYWTPERREAARQRGLEFAKDPDMRLRYGQPGEKNPMWEDGRSQIPYAPGWARKVKSLAWERAGSLCEICGEAPCDTHHIDFSKDNHSLDNLQVLCRKCHKHLHAVHLRNSKSLQC